MIKKTTIFFLFFLISMNTSFSQEIIPLWEENIPNYQESNEYETTFTEKIIWITKVQKPSLEIYLPAKKNATGKAMVICPGGGYGGVAYDWEGTEIAKWLNSIGIAAFVLKYRLPESKSVVVNNEAPLQDAQRAMRIVRNSSKKWNVLKDQIGVMGFSAGGHLASTLGTHYNHYNLSKPDSIDSLSAKPNFMVLMYPVITMKTPHTHLGSRKNLLGESPKQELIDFYSNELHIDKNTPPTLLIHATDDKAVPVENSLLFYQGLKDAGVSAEMHIYPTGGHGFSLAIGKGHLQTWTNRFEDWIKSIN